LSVSERARQLRAGYALQCADLRSRIERRVNRIPLAIRKMTMGELVQQHEAAAKQNPTKASPPKQTLGGANKKPLPALPSDQQALKPASPIRLQAQQIAVPSPRGKKRGSNEIQIATDATTEQDNDTLPVQKNTKRAKTTTTTAPTRTTSRVAKNPPLATTSVLSPRSNNSRTLPRSPIKGDAPPSYLSPTKSLIGRPTTTHLSPIRPTSPLKSAATAATSAIRATAARLGRTASKEKLETGTTGKGMGRMLPPPRPLPTSPSPQRTISQSSSHSSTTELSTASSSTTIVKPKRGATRTTTKTTAVKSPVVKKSGVARAASAAKTALKRNAAGTTQKDKVVNTTGKKVVVAEPATGRRVLRKRN
jgi:hypothetical protein